MESWYHIGHQLEEEEEGCSVRVKCGVLEVGPYNDQISSSSSSAPETVLAAMIVPGEEIGDRIFDPDSQDHVEWMKTVREMCESLRQRKKPPARNNVIADEEFVTVPVHMGADAPQHSHARVNVPRAFVASWCKIMRNEFPRIRLVSRFGACTCEECNPNTQEIR